MTESRIRTLFFAAGATAVWLLLACFCPCWQWGEVGNERVQNP